jgi:membrane protein implicated in regulation of membrane protease activity
VPNNIVAPALTFLIVGLIGVALKLEGIALFVLSCGSSYVVYRIYERKERDS